MNTQSNETIFKVAIIGDAGCGKTSWIKRIRTGEFDGKYQATMGVEVNPVTFTTTEGKVTFNCWDCAGQEKLSGLNSGYYIGAQAIILFFDVTRRDTFANLAHWIKLKNETAENVPMILVGNKVDCRDRRVLHQQIQENLATIGSVAYYDLSAKSNYNFEKPFIHLARLLTGKETLAFTP
jgi:GTP-binding nuclear protein Ran